MQLDTVIRLNRQPVNLFTTKANAGWLDAPVYFPIELILCLFEYGINEQHEAT